MTGMILLGIGDASIDAAGPRRRLRLRRRIHSTAAYETGCDDLAAESVASGERMRDRNCISHHSVDEFVRVCATGKNRWHQLWLIPILSRTIELVPA